MSSKDRRKNETAIDPSMFDTASVRPAVAAANNDA